TSRSGNAVPAVSDEQVLKLSRVYGGEEEVLRLTSEPDLAGMFGLAAHPSKAGRKVTTRNRAHAPDEEDATAEDPDAAIARYLKMHEKEWGSEARHAGSHGSTRHPVLTPKQ